MQLIPNIIERPSDDLANLLRTNYSEELVDSFFAQPAVENIITGVNVNIKNIRIFDNHSGFLTSKLQLFDVEADIYPIVMLITNDTKEPIKFGFHSVFNGINDGDELAIGNNLTVLREYDNPPKFIDIHILIMKSNEKSRDLSQKLKEIMASKNINDSLNAIIAISSAANPAVSLITDLGRAILTHIISFLSEEQDEQVFYGVKSMNMYPDNLGIGKQHILTDKKNAEIIFEVQGF